MICYGEFLTGRPAKKARYGRQLKLVKPEQDPSDAKILDNIFRLVHTIKGTCGFLGLPRLEALAHAGETLMGKFRDGMPVTRRRRDADPVLDRPTADLAGLKRPRTSPQAPTRGPDRELHEMAEGGAPMRRWSKPPCGRRRAMPGSARDDAGLTGGLVLERLLRPGEVSLDDPNAFRETAIEAAPVPVAVASP